jgi:hypothetical protein
MVIPIGFSAPVTFELNSGGNFSTPTVKSCGIEIKSAGENMAGSDEQCVDPGIDRLTYTSTDNSSNFDQMSYDYGVLANLGNRTTDYATNVNDFE